MPVNSTCPRLAVGRHSTSSPDDRRPHPRPRPVTRRVRSCLRSTTIRRGDYASASGLTALGPDNTEGRLRWDDHANFATLRLHEQSDGLLRVETEYREEWNSDNPDYNRTMPNHNDLVAYLKLLRTRVQVVTSTLPDLAPVRFSGSEARRLYTEGDIFTPVMRHCETDHLLGRYYRSTRYRDEGFRITAATLDTGQAHMVLELTAKGDAARRRAGVVLACQWAGPMPALPRRRQILGSARAHYRAQQYGSRVMRHGRHRLQPDSQPQASRPSVDRQFKLYSAGPAALGSVDRAGRADPGRPAYRTRRPVKVERGGRSPQRDGSLRNPRARRRTPGPRPRRR